jgi:hypothetical protein
LCRVLKYQTKESLEGEGKTDENGTERKRKEVGGSSAGMLLGGRVSKIDGENGIQRLEKDGKMDCAYCWTVKVDMFGMPMLIIMNVRMIDLLLFHGPPPSGNVALMSSSFYRSFTRERRTIIIGIILDD